MGTVQPETKYGKSGDLHIAYQVNHEVDVRGALGSIRTPTLVIHRAGNRLLRADHGRYLAEHIPGARLLEVPGNDASWFVEDTNPVLDEIQEFLTGVRPGREPDRVLATVMLTDVVSSTETAAQVGDRGWRDTLEAHAAAVRRQVGRFHGKLIRVAGEEALARFDSPARAIRCAAAIRDAVRNLGLELRARLHTGEIELVGDDVGGIAVHIGERASAWPGPMRCSSRPP